MTLWLSWLPREASGSDVVVRFVNNMTDRAHHMHHTYTRCKKAFGPHCSVQPRESGPVCVCASLLRLGECRHLSVCVGGCSWGLWGLSVVLIRENIFTVDI